jgi:hypothetical protein
MASSSMMLTEEQFTEWQATAKKDNYSAYVDVKILQDGRIAIIEKDTGEAIQYVQDPNVAKGLLKRWTEFFSAERNKYWCL